MKTDNEYSSNEQNQRRKTETPKRIPEAKFRDYWRVLLSKKWIVLSGFLLVIAATVIYIKKATPVYQAETVLMREEELSSAVSLFQTVSPFSTTLAIESQQLFLKSKLILTEVAKQMAANGFPMIPDNIRKNISLSATGKSTDVLTITATADNPTKAMMVTNTTADVYISKTAEMKSSKLARAETFLQQQMTLTDTKLQQAEEALNTFREREGIIGSRNRLGEGSSGLLQQLGDLYTELSQTQMDEELIIAQLNIARQLADEKKKEITPLLTNQSASRIEQWQSMISEWQIELAVLKQTFTDKDKEVISLQEKINAAQSQLESEFQRLLNEQGAFTNPLSEWQSFMQQSVQLDIQLRGLQQKEKLLQEKITRFKEEHPQLISKEIELTRLERQARLHEQTYMLLMEKYEETRMLKEMKGAGIMVIDRATEPTSPIKPKKRLVLTLGIMIGLLVGVSGAFFLEYLDDSLRTEKDIDKYLQLSVVGVIPKIEPEKKTLKALEDTLRKQPVEQLQLQNGEPGSTSEEDGKYHSQSIATAKPIKKKKRSRGYEKRRLNLLSRMITNIPSKSPIVESYRTLRTNIKFAGVNTATKAILISSPGPGEGKTLTAANLAITMARMGARTLMVDSDLRRPRLHVLFQQKKEPGLSDLLIDDKDSEDGREVEHAAGLLGRKKDGRMETEQAKNSEDILSNLSDEFIRKTDVDNLYLFPAGTRPPNPAELLSSERMKNLMESLKTQFDFIIFDSPPIVPVTDATVIASELADTVLLVVQSGETKREIGLRAKELLEKVDANIFGVVLNTLDYTKQYGSYYYYYYYHYYYSHDEEESAEDEEYTESQ